MKKIKFLNGIGAMIALAAVTFTSCEKEEFNVEVTPVNATATIKPVVLSIENGVTTDVTADATITYDPAGSFTGAPALAETPVTVKAVYDGEEASVKVTVPALAAGQSVVLTPTIVLSKEYTISMDTESTEEAPVEKVKDIDNYEMWWYDDCRIKYTHKSGMDVIEDSKEINTEDLSEIAVIKSFFDSLNETYIEEEKTQNVTVYANSRTTVTVAYTITTNKINIVKKVAATKAEQAPLATILTKDYVTVVSVSDNQDIPGHGHSHGHGHGHGNYDNAGGGIIIGD